MVTAWRSMNLEQYRLECSVDGTITTSATTSPLPSLEKMEVSRYLVRSSGSRREEWSGQIPRERSLSVRVFCLLPPSLSVAGSVVSPSASLPSPPANKHSPIATAEGRGTAAVPGKGKVNGLCLVCVCTF